MIEELLEIGKVRQHKIACLKQYIKEGLPIIQFGNGLLAKETKKWLREQEGLLITDQFVSDEVKSNIQEKTFEDIKKIYDRFVVLICVANPRIVQMKCGIFRMDNQVVDVMYLGDNYPSGEAFLTMDYVKSHAKELETVYSCLEDDLSRQSMFNFLAAKLSGESRKWLNYNNAVDNAGIEYFNSLFPEVSPMVFVDGGAYDGDTYQDFIAEGLNYSRYYAFEPDETNYNKLVRSTRSDNKVICINRGLHSEETVLNFDSVGTMSSKIISNESVNKVKVTSIDNIARDATFIKLDIEGAEMDALEGAIHTIREQKPHLAICAYHTISDVWRIPMLIRTLDLQYHIYYRIHQHEWWRDLIMYAYADK